MSRAEYVDMPVCFASESFPTWPWGTMEPTMRRIILIAACLLGSSPLFGVTDPATQQVLTKSLEQASLFHQQAKPFQLDVDFSAQLAVPTEGHLTLKWEAKDRWWRKV